MFDPPIGFESATLAPTHIAGDQLSIADPALPTRRNTRHMTGRYRPGPEIEISSGDRHFRLAPDVIEFNPQRPGDEMHGVTEHRSSPLDQCREFGIVGETAVPHRQLGVSGVVSGGVHRFQHADRVDPVAQTGTHDAEKIGESGVHPGSEDGTSAAFACVLDPLTICSECMASDEAGGCGDVDAGLQDADHVIDIGPFRVVDDTIRPQGQQCVDVIRGDHPDWVNTAQLADIAPDLLRAPREAANELQLGAAQNRSH
ncbi:unannotated protein [freshwater metagenome]|uniref:Unannotated protein n=1 Tax=freshwater metagenome TaxID=449393 RepID=A0A6J7I8B1_9ZZZZ